MLKLCHRFSAKSEPAIGTLVQADCAGSKFKVAGVPPRMPTLVYRCPLCHGMRDEPPGLGLTIFYVEEEVDELPSTVPQRGTTSALGTFHVEIRYAPDSPRPPVTQDEVIERAKEVRDKRPLRFLRPLGPKRRRT